MTPVGVVGLTAVQVRFHGLEGTTPQSMLGPEEHVALVPRWRIDDTKPPSLWSAKTTW